VDTEVDDDGDETSSGVRITRIVDDSPASRADLEVGDRMLAVDGEAVESLSELQTIVGRHAPGDEVEVRLERDGGQSTVSIVVGAKPGRHELVRSQLIGTELPDVEVETSSKEGESEGFRTRSIDAWSGRPVVVEFWATWCAPCRQLEPVLRTLEKQYGDRLHVLGVSSEGWTTLRSYRSEHGPLPYDVLRDGDRSLHDRWFVSSYPTLVVVDASGEVESVLFGLDGARRLESIVGSMLEGSESTEDRDAADDGERDDGADE
jgi:thiol-disulfide isomerase/thioredoxin